MIDQNKPFKVTLDFKSVVECRYCPFKKVKSYYASKEDVCSLLLEENKCPLNGKLNTCPLKNKSEITLTKQPDTFGATTYIWEVKEDE